MIGMVAYLIFFPTLVLSFLFDFLQAEGELPIFPGIADNLDFFGLTAYIVYFALHTFIILVFLQSLRVFIFSVIMAFVNLGIYVGLTQFILGTIAFIYGENLVFSIQEITLISIIVQYNVIWLIFIFILREFFLTKNLGK